MTAIVAQKINRVQTMQKLTYTCLPSKWSQCDTNSNLKTGCNNDQRPRALARNRFYPANTLSANPMEISRKKWRPIRVWLLITEVPVYFHTSLKSNPII